MNRDLSPFMNASRTSWVTEHIADSMLRLSKPWLDGSRCEATIKLALSRFQSLDLPKLLFDLAPTVTIGESALLVFDLAQTLSRYDTEVALTLLNAIPLHVNCGPREGRPILLLSSCLLTQPENKQAIYRISLPSWTNVKGEGSLTGTPVSLSSFSPSPVMGFPRASALRPGSDSDKSISEVLRVDAARAYIWSLAIYLGIQSGLLQEIRHEAYRYAHERKSFQKSLCQHQAVALRLADMSVSGDSFDLVSRDLLLHLSHELQTGIHESCAVKGAIPLLSDFAYEITRDALQIAGGHGYVDGLPFKRSFEQSKVISIITAQIFH